MMDVNSLWSHTANRSKHRDPLRDNIEVDVAIIGGGYTGMAAAYFLLQSGYRVAILEKHTVAWGASGRNAGMVLPGYKMDLKKMISMWGIDATRTMFQLSIDGIHMVENISKTHNIDCSINPCGFLKAAFKPEHLEKFKRHQEFMQKHFNYETQIVDRQHMDTELGTDFYHGVQVDPHGISFHPLNYALGLADVIEEKGGRIYENTEIIQIEHLKQGYKLHSSEGVVKASHTVIATNGYSTSLHKKIEKSVIPIGSYIIATEPLTADLAKQLIPNKRMVSDSKKLLYYFKLSPDNRLVFGGRASFDGIESPELYDNLRKSMLTVFPQLKDVKVDFKWGGLTGFTVNHLPRVGRLKDGLHYALGYSGRGSAVSMVLGKIIAANITGEQREKTPLEGLPLSTVPLHSQRKISLNLASTYYALYDRFK